MIFDALAMVDRDPRTEIGCTSSELTDRLTSHNVSRALMCSFQAVFDHYETGNGRTLEVANASNGFFVPVASINPLAWSGQTECFGQMRRQGFRALALFPHLQGWSWNAIVGERIVKEADRAGLAVIAHADEPSAFSTACRVLGSNDVPAIMRYANRGAYSIVSELLEAAQRFPKLKFDVGGMAQSGIIEFLASKIGAGRLCISSGAPVCFEAAALFSLAASRLDDQERIQIENGTLAGLLDCPIDHATTPNTAVYERMVQLPKVDTHWHTGSWHLVEPRLSFGDISEELDKFNIVRTCSSSIQALNWDIRRGNEETLRLLEKDERVCGLIVINPHQNDISLGEIEQYARHPRFVGLKTIQDFYLDQQPLGLDHPNYKPLLAWADDNRWPVMAHLPGMFEAAQNHPNALFVAAHSTWRFKQLATLPNVYFDIATSSPFRSDADFAGLVDAVGEDRVIFSSDSQLMGPAWTLGKLASSGLGWSVLEKILRINASEAFPRLGALMERKAA